MKKSINGKELIAQAKADVKAKQIAERGTPWYVKAVVFLFDFLAAVIILALAIQGAKNMLGTNLSEEVKYGLAALVIGLFAARLIERIFKARG